MTVASVDEELLQRRLAQVTSEQHTLEVICELARRARNRFAEDSTAKRLIGVGHVQAIGLLLDIPYTTALKLVRDEQV